MKTYEEIKKEEYESTKGFSDRKLNMYIMFCGFLGKILNIKVLWAISVIPIIAIPLTLHILGILSFGFVDALVITIAHFIYWRFRGEKDALNLLDDTLDDFEMTMRALKEIKEERKNG